MASEQKVRPNGPMAQFNEYHLSQGEEVRVADKQNDPTANCSHFITGWLLEDQSLL